MAAKTKKKGAAPAPIVPVPEAAAAVDEAARALIVAIEKASAELSGRIGALKAGLAGEPSSTDYEAAHVAKQAVAAALHAAQTALEKAARDL